MKIKHLISLLPSVAMMLLVSCNDDVSVVGGSLTEDEVSIVVDSTFVVTGESVYSPQINSKSMTQMIGHINVAEYGDLSCSFVSQLMPATTMNIPDEVTEEMVDSMRFRFRFANGNLTGDSLAPQQLRVYELTRQLPSDIDNNFDPAGFFDASKPLGIKGYSGTALGMVNSVYNNKDLFRAIYVKMPREFVKRIYNAYRNNPEIFANIDNFKKFFPGIYVQQSFGRGMVLNIGSTDLIAYYHRNVKKTVVVDGVSVEKDTIQRDTIALFNVSQEVVSSNNIKLKIADNVKRRVAAGDAVLMSPAGYNVKLQFPTQAILNRYYSSTSQLQVVNGLSFQIPVEEIHNNFAIAPAPYLLMVKTKDLPTYFLSRTIPDNKTSFYATYDSDNKRYNFIAMRGYIDDLVDGGVRNVNSDDCDFTLIPVRLVMETASDGSGEVVVTECMPYLSHPTMCVLKLDKAKIKFTFSKQNL